MTGPQTFLCPLTRRQIGIVTKIDLFTHSLIKLQYNITLYNPDNYVEINKATVKVQQEMEKDPKIGMFTNYNSAFVAVGLIYADTPEKKPEAFEAFDLLSASAAKIGMACDTTNGTLLSLAKAMSHPGINLKYGNLTLFARKICLQKPFTGVMSAP